MAGKQVIPPEEMIAKLKAALDARSDPDLSIMARTDALGVHGIADAIERACRYRDAGADLIFVEAVESVEQMRQVIAAVPAPQMANMVPGGRTPALTAQELQEIGYAIVAYATANTYIIAKAATDLFTELYATGTTAGLESRMITFDEFNRLVGLPEIRAAEQRFEGGVRQSPSASS
jgi:methylisocitrate lyase